MSDTHDYETVDLTPPQLNSTHVLVGEAGGLSAVYSAKRSSANPGLWAVETEHGFLYLDPDHKYAVLVA